VESPPEGVERVAPDLAWVHQELKRPGVTLQRLHLEYLVLRIRGRQPELAAPSR
jgi:hypothetical protein